MRTNLVLFSVFCFLFLNFSFAQDIELHGFVDYRYGSRLQADAFEDDKSLNELRVQLDSVWYHDLFTAQIKSDLVYDDLSDNQDDIDLEVGHGILDLRQANIQFSPLLWMDVKFGRQALTWGTGDLLFVNDLFPKDWQSFFLGRDVEYLKAPSDSLFVSLFPSFASVDIAYTPRFDADRHITGERISYWNGQEIVGQNSLLDTERPDDWFEDDEIALRIYRNVSSYELAFYGYHGFWKSPGGIDPVSGKWIFPKLSVYGASARGAMGVGIANIEAGYYDSRDDSDGNDPFVNNSETRFLVGYEQEAIKDMTIGVQYYLEHMQDYGAFKQSLEDMGLPTETAPDEDRHTFTLRITWMLLNQNLVLSCFTRYSPSDDDIYVKPVGTYKISDIWQAEVGGNVFSGDNNYSFLAQFENNSNIYASLRCSF